jgi:hypothetical protein
VINWNNSTTFFVGDYLHPLLTGGKIQWIAERKKVLGFDLQKWAKSRELNPPERSATESDLFAHCWKQKTGEQAKDPKTVGSGMCVEDVALKALIQVSMMRRSHVTLIPVEKQ